MEKGATTVEYAVMLVLIVIAVVTVVTPLGKRVGGLFSSVEPELSDGTAPTQEPLPPSEEINFSEQGNLVAAQSGACQLLYSRMGAPALTADLAFQDYSICDLDQGEQACRQAKQKLLRGQEIKVEGQVVEEKEMGEGLPEENPLKGQKFPSKVNVVKLTVLPNPEFSELGDVCCVPSEQYSQ